MPPPSTMVEAVRLPYSENRAQMSETSEVIVVLKPQTVFSVKAFDTP